MNILTEGNSFMLPYYSSTILFFIFQGYISHHKAIDILAGKMLATSCLCLDMTCTSKNITKYDDVEIKELRHTADLHVYVALLKVSNDLGVKPLTHELIRPTPMRMVASSSFCVPQQPSRDLSLQQHPCKHGIWAHVGCKKQTLTFS